jgi:putative spermidine/putrescine transport system permease protein
MSEFSENLPWHRRIPDSVLWIMVLSPVLLVLFFFFLVPLGYLMERSLLPYVSDQLTPVGAYTLENYRAVFGDPWYWRLLGNSLWLGFMTTILSICIGYAVAFYITRAGSWERTLISVACLLPVFVNVTVGILGWYILLLPFGVLQQLFAELGLIQGPLRWLRSLWALTGVLVYEHLPFAILILVSSLQSVPQDKINAARLLGASTPRIVTSIMIPLTMPGIVASAVLIFSLSISSYLVPVLISGPRTPVIPISIFSYMSELMNWNMASVLAFFLMLTVAAITYGFIALTSRLTRRGQWGVV